MQRSIDEIAPLLTAAQMKRIVDRMNRDDEESIACEYEILLLRVLGKQGIVKYEADAPGSSRKPDIDFRSADPDLEFVADITTVSDVDSKAKNPADVFERSFYQMLRKEGVPTRGFNIQIEGRLEGPRPGDQKMVLCLPAKRDIPAFVNGLRPFATQIKRDPARRSSISFDEPKAHLSISYNPKGTGNSGGHVVFTVPYSLKRNPVSNALKDKSKQLKGVDADRTKGIILCDGDCTILGMTTLGGWRPHFSQEDVVNYFLDRNRSISFVAFLAVQDDVSTLPVRFTQVFISTVFRNRKAHRPCSDKLYELLRGLPSLLPKPQSTAINALHWYGSAYRREGRSFRGGLTVSGNEIRMSLRALVELLAEAADPARFFQDQKHFSFSSPPTPETNFFRRQMRAGRTIVSMRVEKQPDRDDDWVDITFGDPDPAISPFRVPSRTAATE